MLGKLIKNEFKATARSFVPVYLVMLVVTIFLKIFLEISDKFKNVNGQIMAAISAILLISFVVSILAVIFGTIIFIIKRFYDNMLKDEGYLSFTLPVTTGQHIGSKALTSYVWVVASAVVIILSIVLLFLGHASFFRAVSDGINDGMKFLSDNGYWGYAVLIFIMIIVGIYISIMEAYACMSVGQLLNKHRVAGAIITYLVFYGIKKMCGIIFLMVTLVGNTADLEMANNYEAEFFVPMLIFEVIMMVVQIVAYTFITHVMMSKKLNLE